MKPEDLMPYERWQLEKYGNILPPVENIPDERVVENGFDDLNRFSEWMQYEAEQQMLKAEEMFAAIKENYL